MAFGIKDSSKSFPYYLNKLSLIDFKNSFVTWRIQNDLHGRFSIESSCEVTDFKTALIKKYYLLSGVLACKVLETDDMIIEPEYIFQAVFSEKDFKIFRINNSFGNKKDSIGLNEDEFADIIIHLATTEHTKLKSDKEVSDALLNFKSLTAIVNFTKTDFNYELQFPVKHINSRITESTWQVETGPVLMPMFSSNATISAQHFLPAFVAFNHHHILNYALLEEEKQHQFQTRSYHKKESLKIDSSLYIIH